eukprot:14009251-Alexandrium_andersonii.AAC.1
MANAKANAKAPRRKDTSRAAHAANQPERPRDDGDPARLGGPTCGGAERERALPPVPRQPRPA